MSFIHYKLITNQDYEKITFDGVSLNVNELKRLIMEKKFRKLTSTSTTNSSSSQSNTSSSSNTGKKFLDVDLEIMNLDTNQGNLKKLYTLKKTF